MKAVAASFAAVRQASTLGGWRQHACHALQLARWPEQRAPQPPRPPAVHVWASQCWPLRHAFSPGFLFPVASHPEQAPACHHSLFHVVGKCGALSLHPCPAQQHPPTPPLRAHLTPSPHPETQGPSRPTYPFSVLACLCVFRMPTLLAHGRARPPRDTAGRLACCPWCHLQLNATACPLKPHAASYTSAPLPTGCIPCIHFNSAPLSLECCYPYIESFCVPCMHLPAPPGTQDNGITRVKHLTKEAQGRWPRSQRTSLTESPPRTCGHLPPPSHRLQSVESMSHAGMPVHAAAVPGVGVCKGKVLERSRRRIERASGDGVELKRGESRGVARRPCPVEGAVAASRGQAASA